MISNSVFHCTFKKGKYIYREDRTKEFIFKLPKEGNSGKICIWEETNGVVLLCCHLSA
jgi:hypothetical protein